MKSVMASVAVISPGACTFSSQHFMCFTCVVWGAGVMVSLEKGIDRHSRSSAEFIGKTLIEIGVLRGLNLGGGAGQGQKACPLHQ